MKITNLMCPASWYKYSLSWSLPNYIWLYAIFLVNMFMHGRGYINSLRMDKVPGSLVEPFLFKKLP
jgi:hypothetical protein